jgi:PAS domain S-box-containing protein
MLDREKHDEWDIRSRLAAIVESSDDAIVSKNLDGIVQSWNWGAERIFGYTAEEMIGQSITILIPISRFDEEPQILQKISHGERIDHYETVRQRKDGKLIDVSLTVSPIYDSAGKVVGASKIARDVTERHRADYLARQLAAIIESSQDGIIGLDLNCNVTSWNLGAENLYGYAAEEMIGTSISKLCPSDRLDEEPLLMARIIAGERVEHYETKRQNKNGKVIDVSLTWSPIQGAKGQIIGASKIARDVTERIRMQNERNQLLESERAARAEAERATRLRDEFLAIVSHELRTPLNGIMGWAQLLKRSKTSSDPSVLAEAAEAIERGTHSQAQLIDDLLDMNRIMTGKLHLDIQSVQLAAVIGSALNTLKPAAEAKGIRFQTTLATKVASIRGDPTRLQQVIWNLLSNAVKFTPKGGKIQVLLERINSHVEISVGDTGIGIRPEFLPYVFERFRQADSSTSRRHGGLGLGLAIAKQIVELHGGSISAESRGEGQGSTFHVSLPISIINRPTEVEAEIVNTVQTAEDALKGIRVLIVDDDPNAAEVVRRLLESCGAYAIAANSGDEALTSINQMQSDVILCDIGMPGMDGYEFIGALRKTGNVTPAIAVTAFARPEDRIRSLQAGFAMHLSKPIDIRELTTVMQAVLRSSGNLSQYSAADAR